MIKVAFTLAEILITLLIIGVVASLVVPNLINDIQDQQYKVAWKKAYAEISQVSNQLLLDEGGTYKNMCASFDTFCIANKFGQYFSATKKCNSNASGICYKTRLYLSGIMQDTASVESNLNSVFYLSDGSYLIIRWHSGSCTFTLNNNKCGWMHVDINGDKPPNKMGKDEFGITVLENRILPYGAKDAYGEGADDCNSAGMGYYCATKFLY